MTLSDACPTSSGIPCYGSEGYLFFQCMGEYRGNMLSMFLYSAWERRRVNLICLPDLAGDMN